MNSGDIVATAPHQTIQIDPIETAPFRLSPTEIRGIKGALRIPSLSFQLLRRPGCTAKLLCFHTVSNFDPHCLSQLLLSFQCVMKLLKGTKGALSHPRTLRISNPFVW